MKAGELAGIALNSPDQEEIRQAIRSSVRQFLTSAMDADDQYLFAQCAHAMGHLARRFGTVDRAILAEIVEIGEEHGDLRPISGAVVDMWDDLEHFIPEMKRTAFSRK